MFSVTLVTLQAQGKFWPGHCTLVSEHLYSAILEPVKVISRLFTHLDSYPHLYQVSCLKQSACVFQGLEDSFLGKPMHQNNVHPHFEVVGFLLSCLLFGENILKPKGLYWMVYLTWHTEEVCFDGTSDWSTSISPLTGLSEQCYW